MSIKFKTINVRGVQYEVSVDDTGTFNCWVTDDTHLSANTFSDLKDKIAKETKKKSQGISVPFVRCESGTTIRRGALTGIHASTDNLMVRWEDTGKTEQEHGWRHTNLYLQVTPEEEHQYSALLQDSERAREALSQFIETHKFNGHEAIKAKMMAKPEVEP